ncbi:uncharacterized protein LOC144326214 isoform X1 [Podarcis muralis]
MDKSKKRKISEENRMFNDKWTESFAFSTDKTGLPVCLICGEKFANNKKSNIARHFQNKHTAFAEKYPDGDERRKKAIAELMRKVDRSKNNFKNWVKSANSTTYASFVAAQEIVKHDHLVAMPSHKKRKKDLECHIFNKKWTHDYFFVELKGMPVCLICGEALSILKKANLQRHHRTKHIQYEEFQGQLREEKVKALKMDLHAQQGIAPEPRKEMDSVEQASFVVSELVSKKLRPLSRGELVKECIVATAALLAPEKLKLFESVSFSRRRGPAHSKNSTRGMEGSLARGPRLPEVNLESQLLAATLLMPPGKSELEKETQPQVSH